MIKKKEICGRPGEDFSRHPDFRKQEYFSFWPKQIASIASKTKKKTNNIAGLKSILELTGYFRLSLPNFRQKAKLLFGLLKRQENTERSKQPLQRKKIDQQALCE